MIPIKLGDLVIMVNEILGIEETETDLGISVCILIPDGGRIITDPMEPNEAHQLVASIIMYSPSLTRRYSTVTSDPLLKVYCQKYPL